MIINGKNSAYLINDLTYHCALDVTMKFIGGKWKCVVIWYLRNETLRFSEIKKKIPDITEKMLSIQLKALELEDLVKREVFGEKPPIRVEYSLTDFGRTMIPVVETIAAWGRKYAEENGKLVSTES